jgi:hypothetical protein
MKMKKAAMYLAAISLAWAAVAAPGADNLIRFTGAVVQPTLNLDGKGVPLWTGRGAPAALIKTVSRHKLTDRDRGSIPLLDYFADHLAAQPSALAAAMVVETVYN